MQPFPSAPPLEEADPRIFAEGHLWLLEHVDGVPLRFRLRPSGLLEFGTRNRTVTDPTQLPPEYHHATFHIEDRLERDAIRAAVDDPTAVTFLGVATQRRTVEYEWAELPSFLGVDVRTEDRTSPYPPDVAHASFGEVGLDPINPIEREVRPRDFAPANPTFPPSAWYDGAAAGVLIRNKRGGRALATNEELPNTDPLSASDAESLATEMAARIDGLVADLERSDRPISVDRLAERLAAEAWRTHHEVLSDSRDPIDEGHVRAACAAVARNHLG